MIRIKRVRGDVEWFIAGFRIQYGRRCVVTMPGCPWMCFIIVCNYRSNTLTEISWEWRALK